MLQLHPVYSLWNRRKTLTGSLDPMHANSTNKPCSIKQSDTYHVVGKSWPIHSFIMDAIDENLFLVVPKTIQTEL